ncbi:MAG: diaminopimelate decarboxylase [Oscillospiraceae bacterium]|jgi:diaminopimelate decarboxylase|nr:diaminopimelate decarboxylase [Oscillospiraceae bacterium]
MHQDNISINNRGHLVFAGFDTVELAREYGTPLYVMDERMIRDTIAMYRVSMENYYQGRGLVCYASKAFSCKHIYRVCREEGIGADAVSMGELYTAMEAGFDPALICYHGNNKTPAELEYALDCGVGRIVADSFRELDLLEEIAARKGRKAGILLRLCPGIEAHTHDFIRTGGIDSKFGFAIELGIALEAVEHALSKPHLELRGVHAHIGSQIFQLEPFRREAEVLMGFLAEVRAKTGAVLSDLNLGGGFGIRYTQADDPVPYGQYMEAVTQTLKETCAGLDYPLPFVIMEPGRSIVGAAGITLYEIGNRREIPGVRTYLSVDGGMTDNIRYALYGAEYTFTVANRAGGDKTLTAAIAGRCCESGDLLAKEARVQQCGPGDILAVFSTGAYNYSMASNYNRVPRPPVVMLLDGTAHLAVRRESLADLVRNDL